MIHVIATIEVVPGKRAEYLTILREVAAEVRAERGCLAYVPTVDIPSGLPVQCDLRENVVTLVEAWESLDHLHAHLKSAHMRAYRGRVQEFVTGLSIQVLEPA